MSNYKTDFELENASGKNTRCFIRIIGAMPKNSPYVTIEITPSDLYKLFIPDKDLERFAVNILRALKSKRLKP